MMKLFPPAVIVDATTHFSIKHHIITGGTSLCYCDEMQRAEIVKMAVNSWRRTKAGKRYWRKLTQE